MDIFIYEIVSIRYVAKVGDVMLVFNAVLLIYVNKKPFL